jgi:NTE family protein
MLGTLERLADFELLNSGTPRFTVTAVDIESGEDIVFDTRTHRIVPEHIRASAALLPVFAPVDIGGRLLGDAGISANLPLDSVLSEPSDRPLLCIAIDLLPLGAPRPETLGGTVARMQDLMFATQSRRAIAAWQALYDERARNGDPGSVTILHIAYANHAREVSGKAFDFSPQSVAERWASGRDDLAGALAALDGGAVAAGEAGLGVYSASGSTSLQKVRWSLKPVSG